MAGDESVGEQVKGSYTIEMSLLMGVILPILVGVIYLGFFWHDQAFLQAAAHETASWASLHKGEEKTQEVLQKLIEGRLLGTAQVEVIGSVGEKEVSVHGSGGFAMPGLLQNLFEKMGVKVEAEVHVNTESPSKRIQKIRGLMKIADSVRGKET